MHFRCLGGHGCFPYFASIGNIVKPQKPKDMFATPKMNKMRFKKISAPAAGDAVATSWNMHNRIEKRGIDSVCAPLSIPEVSAPTDTTGPGKRQSGGHASEFRTSDEKKMSK